jgi:hypothetical protein
MQNLATESITIHVTDGLSREEASYVVEQDFPDEEIMESLARPSGPAITRTDSLAATSSAISSRSSRFNRRRLPRDEGGEAEGVDEPAETAVVVTVFGEKLAQLGVEDGAAWRRNSAHSSSSSVVICSGGTLNRASGSGSSLGRNSRCMAAFQGG